MIQMSGLKPFYILCFNPGINAGVGAENRFNGALALNFMCL